MEAEIQRRTMLQRAVVSKTVESNSNCSNTRSCRSSDADHEFQMRWALGIQLNKAMLTAKKMIKARMLERMEPVKPSI